MAARRTPKDAGSSAIAPSSSADQLEGLVQAAADGDRPAQHELLERFWPLIQLSVRARRQRLPRRLRRRDETADVAQGTALKVLEGLAQHRWQGGRAFGAWIRTLARHQVIDHARHDAAARRDARAEVSLVSSAGLRGATRGPESVADDARALRRLLADLQALKPEYGAALLMHTLGFAHGEIGTALGCSDEAARKLVSRGRVALLALRRGRR